MASNAITTPATVQTANGSPAAGQVAATAPATGAPAPRVVKDLGVNQQPVVDETESLLMAFDPKGSKQAKADASSVPIYQLWKILDKWTVDSKFGSIVYEVQFWEDIHDRNEIYHVDGKQLWDNYQQSVEQWEDTFGKYWQTKYGKIGHVWDSTTGNIMHLPGSAPKRRFDDTPSKSRSTGKKTRSEGSSISGGSDVGLNTPSTNTPRSDHGNHGNQYTLLPPLLPASVRSARRPTTRQSNVGLSSGFSITARSARRSTLGSPPLIGQSARGFASRFLSQSTRNQASGASSLIGQLARLGFYRPKSTSSSLPDPMDIDKDERNAEEQLKESSYNPYYSESDDEHDEKLGSFDMAAFDATMNAIAEQTEADLRPDEDITMVGCQM
ncbi:hypothetical protein OCU04_008837 [Sclerotinia nivalis]|uniref:Uncharacterized protein n=1 Tax=Sclerotinia nivalis TaxID=352851 RepID=A0A9X0AGD6_9HELO|nr:hypothetical protein OCU04_008837 [Sclerotinia nivalis]